MKRIIIIGCPGSGKSTFARKLNEKTAIPLYHLDMMYWNTDKTVVEKEIFMQRLYDALQREEWIIDGNYASTMEIRFEKCDTVFFLDLPKETCIEGIYSRRGKPRKDMPWTEPMEIDEDFLSFVENYNTVNRPLVLDLLSRYSDKKIIVFKSRKEAEEYIKSEQF